MPLYKLVGLIASFSILIPLVYSLYLLWVTKGKGKLLWQLFWFILFTTLVEATIRFIGMVLHQHNIWVQHIYIPLEYALLAFIFMGAFHSKTAKNYILASIVFFVLFCLADTLFLEDFFTATNAYSQGLESILLIILAFSYFYKLLQYPSDTALSQNPYFLLSIACLIYFAGSASYSILFNVLLEYSPEFLRLSTSLLSIFIIYFYMMLVWILKKAAEQ